MARFEIATAGFDEFTQLVGGDPSLTPNATGLRIPALPGLRYLMLCAACDLAPGDRAVGYRQLTTMCFPKPGAAPPPTGPLASASAPAPPVYPFEVPIETPGWHFIDGFTSTHLTVEPRQPQRTNIAAVPQSFPSLAYEDSQTAAMVYETIHFPAVPTAPGYLGLDAYTPPALLGNPLQVLRDVRNPWQGGAGSYVSLDYVAPIPSRLRGYVSVLQTDPTSRNEPTLTGLSDLQIDFASTSLAREDRLIVAFPRSFLYWRAALCLIVETRDERRFLRQFCDPATRKIAKHVRRLAEGEDSCAAASTDRKHGRT